MVCSHSNTAQHNRFLHSFTPVLAMKCCESMLTVARVCTDYCIPTDERVIGLHHDISPSLSHTHSG